MTRPVHQDRKANSDTDNPQARKQRVNWEVIECIVAGCIVILTCFQTWFLYQSNLVAAGSLDLARTTAEKQLRAYVLAVTGEVVGLSHGQIKVRVTISNSGQTPAYRLSVTMYEKWREYQFQNQFENISAEPQKAGAIVVEEGVQATLAPGEKMYIEHIVEPRRYELMRGDAALYASGTIEYTDIYGKRCKTSFSFVQGGEYDPSSPLMGVAD